MPRYTACDDFHHTDALHRDAGASGGLTRRQVLRIGAGASLALYLGPSSPVQRALEAAQASAAVAPSAPILVSVFLPGGLDLLDTIVPLNQYGAYQAARGSMARPKTSPALGKTGLGMHDSLGHGNRGGVKGLYDAGKIGLLPGIDYANPNLSHFNSRAFWETGLVTQQSATGWLGRWADMFGSGDNPLQGISMGAQLDPVLRSSRAPMAAVENAKSVALTGASMDADVLKAATDAYARLGAASSKRPGRDAVNRGVRLTKQVADLLANLSDGAPAAVAPTSDLADQVGSLIGVAPAPAVDDSAPAYPKSVFGDRLRTLAFLLSQPLGVRLGAVQAPGAFDTHNGQENTLTNLLSDVSQGLAAFQLDIEQRGIADRVLVLVWSEFGRRVKGNASLGTDHGAGGIGWVQGTKAKSGVLTEYPNLTDLDALKNLKVTVDFRQIYASLLEQWFAADANAVIPLAAGMPRVGLVA